jgi:hypothetical protein
MKKVTVKLPSWAFREIDKEAKRMGVSLVSLLSKCGLYKNLMISLCFVLD